MYILCSKQNDLMKFQYFMVDEMNQMGDDEDDEDSKSVGSKVIEKKYPTIQDANDLDKETITQVMEFYT